MKLFEVLADRSPRQVVKEAELAFKKLAVQLTNVVHSKFVDLYPPGDPELFFREIEDNGEPDGHVKDLKRFDYQAVLPYGNVFHLSLMIRHHLGNDTTWWINAGLNDLKIDYRTKVGKQMAMERHKVNDEFSKLLKKEYSWAGGNKIIDLGVKGGRLQAFMPEVKR